MAALDIDGALSNIRTLISTLTQWQTVTGSANAAAALAYIYRGGFTDDGSITAPYCVIDIEDFNATWNAGRFKGELSAVLWFELAVPEASQTTYETQYVWVWQQLSGILAGINGGVQGGGQQMSEGLSLIIKPGLVEPDENTGRRDWRFALGLSGVLI